MRFGTFHLPLSPNPEDDYRVIQEQLEQCVATERLGFDTIWLTEHNFTGECAFGDPIPFAGAVAALTKRVDVGFAVVQMALHHPTRLAIQAGVLDNLLNGRLILGIGRGSSYNEYEYVAFGLRSDGSRERMFEAVDLMTRAWTEERLEWDTENYKLMIPSIRPAPVQKPHPRIQMAVLSDDTLRWSATRGFPVMFARIGVEQFQERVRFYAKAMSEAGFGEEAVRQNVKETTLLRSIYISDSVEQAEEEVKEATYRLHAHLQHTRSTFNPKDVDMRQRARFKWTSPDSTADEAVAELMSRGFIIGTADTVAEQIAEIRDAGCDNLMCTMTWGGMDHGKVMKSMESFSENVLSKFQKDSVSVAL